LISTATSGAVRGLVIGSGISRALSMSLTIGGNVTVKENFAYYIERTGGNNIKLIDSTTGFFTNIYSPASTTGGLRFLNNVSAEIMRINATGNILINTTTDAGFRLDVNGTARVQGVLTTTADAVVNGVSVGRGGGNIVSNTRVGTNNLGNNTTGVNNVAVGYEAGLNNTTADNNSFFGGGSGRSNTTGARNSFIGQDAGRSNTTGFGNSFFGQNAGYNTTSGGGNIAIGRDSLFTNNTGTNNIAIGTNSLINLIGTNSNNIALGINSGRFIADGTTANTITNNSVFIGTDTKALADNQTNQIVIGHTAIGLGSNTTVIGNTSTT
jgi:hypothetical protein